MADPVHFRLEATTLSSPDPRRLAEFYGTLLGGWPVRKAQDGWVALTSPDGGAGLSFHDEAIHERPTWPAQPGRQQMQAHLDILVDDLDRGVQRAVELGATVAGFQPQDDVVVCLDPDGHPFCLFVRS
jgi:catechol 2,3-dioxygenase-like lactoylglutathione lyase family enzyme